MALFLCVCSRHLLHDQMLCAAQVGAARFKLNEGAGLVKKKATEYGQEAKSRVQAGTSLASDIIKQTDTNIPNPAP